MEDLRVGSLWPTQRSSRAASLMLSCAGSCLDAKRRAVREENLTIIKLVRWP